jgi:hypothetical protein
MNRGGHDKSKKEKESFASAGAQGIRLAATQRMRGRLKPWAVRNWRHDGGLVQRESMGTGDRVAQSAFGPDALEKEIS